MREFEWIAKAAGLFGGRHPGVIVGIGDDCAVLEPHGNQLVSTDTVVDGVHLDSRLISWADIGWRSLAVALSDLAGCAADPQKPIAAFIAAQLPKDLADNDLLAFARGMRECADAFGCGIAGGDTVSTPGPFAVTCTVAGYTDKPVLRRGACTGDLIAVTGRIGRAGAGLLALQKNFADADPLCLQAYCRPRPLLAEGRKLAQWATAMIDISDGLLADLAHICRASGVGAQIDLEALPVDAGAEAIFRAANLDAALAAATCGDDYQLLFCLQPCDLEAMQREVEATVVGRIVRGQGVVALRDGRAVDIERPGYEHGR